MSDSSGDGKLVFSSYDEFEEAIEEVQSEKAFKLPDSSYQVFITNVQLDGRHFLSVIVAKKGRYHEELYEVKDGEFNEISAMRRSKGEIDNQKQAAESSVTSLAFEALEKWGEGL